MLFAAHRRAYLNGLPFDPGKEYCKYLYRCAGEVFPSEAEEMSDRRVLCNMEKRKTSTLNAGWEGEN